MSSELFLIIDAFTVGLGFMMIIFPNKVYHWGRSQDPKNEIPKHWNITSRVIGVLAVVFGAFFIYLDISAR